jgi:hypothetical protein
MGGIPAWGLGVWPTTPHLKNFSSYEMFQGTSELDRFLGTTEAIGKGHEI